MKPTLLFATLSLVFASPTLSAKSELEILRARCAEQERQIQQLEEDNMKLRSATAAPRSATVSNDQRAAEGPKTSASGDATYTVKAGDSFEKIARVTGTSVSNLLKMNRLKPSAMIHPGQKLKLVGTTTVAAASLSVPAKSSTSAQTASGRTYQIRSGDTYSSIARKHKVTVASLVAANPTAKASALRVGQTIRLDAGTSNKTIASTPAPKPLVSTSSAPVSAPKAPAQVESVSPAPAVAAAPVETASAPVQETLSSTRDKFRPITIEGEMTYGDFASKHGTDTERLNALNGLDLNNTTVLAKGSELYVPAQP